MTTAATSGKSSSKANPTTHRREMPDRRAKAKRKDVTEESSPQHKKAASSESAEKAVPKKRPAALVSKEAEEQVQAGTGRSHKTRRHASPETRAGVMKTLGPEIGIPDAAPNNLRSSKHRTTTSAGESANGSAQLPGVPQKRVMTRRQAAAQAAQNTTGNSSTEAISEPINRKQPGENGSISVSTPAETKNIAISTPVRDSDVVKPPLTKNVKFNTGAQQNTFFEITAIHAVTDLEPPKDMSTTKKTSVNKHRDIMSVSSLAATTPLLTSESLKVDSLTSVFRASPTPPPAWIRIPFSKPYFRSPDDPENVLLVRYIILGEFPALGAPKPNPYGRDRTYEQLRNLYNNHGPDIINDLDANEWIFDIEWIMKHILKPFDGGGQRYVWPYWIGPTGEIFSVEKEGQYEGMDVEKLVKEATHTIAD